MVLFRLRSGAVVIMTGESEPTSDLLWFTVARRAATTAQRLPAHTPAPPPSSLLRAHTVTPPVDGQLQGRDRRSTATRPGNRGPIERGPRRSQLHYLLGEPPFPPAAWARPSCRRAAVGTAQPQCTLGRLSLLLLLLLMPSRAAVAVLCIYVHGRTFHAQGLAK